jgi:hypothetical protein
VGEDRPILQERAVCDLWVGDLIQVYGCSLKSRVVLLEDAVHYNELEGIHMIDGGV